MAKVTQKRPTWDSGVYGHFLAPAADIDGGAEEFSFVTPFENPVFLVRGPGRVAGQLYAFQPNTALVSLQPVAPADGIPLYGGSPYAQEESNMINDEGTYE